jgi:arylsulfatase A-like enzyme
VLLLSAWCGLIAGLLEVCVIALRKQTLDTNRFYWMSQHFVWLIPAMNIMLFLALGCAGALLCAAGKRRGRWLWARVLCAATILPALLVGFPRIYGGAFLLMALGAAARLVPWIEQKALAFKRSVWISAPVGVGILLLLAGFPWARVWINESRERARPMPPNGSPNVLLIVLDTVAAEHLSLYGYKRPTSPTLVDLAEKGIRFDNALASCSWTLPSHATMFTGRWLHELSAGWLTPLDGKFPTLAEYLGAAGYATAGIIANTVYCSSDSGLARGFTVYEDYIFPQYTVLKIAVLGNRLLRGAASIVQFVESRAALARWQPRVQRIWRSLVVDRKAAAAVNRQLFGWLDHRAQPDRPFFAFLNYSDAHTPYELTPGRMHRFGGEPADERQRELISRWAELDKARLIRTDLPFLIDAYDDCIADLDEQLGKLLDELSRRRILEHTWLVVAADHGESFGEHPSVYCHGTSLYQTEVHVPLLIVPPGGSPQKRVIKETVSLRDLPATVVDLLALAAGSPFPGTSLVPYWTATSSAIAALPAPASANRALAEVVPGDARYRDAYGLPLKTRPMGALSDGEWSYIRTEGNTREELYRLSIDSKQQRNLAREPAAQPVLNRLRGELDSLTQGPLSPERFNR